MVVIRNQFHFSGFLKFSTSTIELANNCYVLQAGTQMRPELLARRVENAQFRKYTDEHNFLVKLLIKIRLIYSFLKTPTQCIVSQNEAERSDMSIYSLAIIECLTNSVFILSDVQLNQ